MKVKYSNQQIVGYAGCTDNEIESTEIEVPSLEPNDAIVVKKVIIEVYGSNQGVGWDAPA